MSIDVRNIKLVIWDLDDTFWRGTLSEGQVIEIPDHNNLVKKLVDKGIMNSICSKNDFEQTKEKLSKLNMWSWFVFPSISWTSKGSRVTSIINDMGLRPVNVLFIDDNDMNLHEVEHFNPGIMILKATDIPLLIQQIDLVDKEDFDHSRLKQYRILEEKRKARNETVSIDEFLLQSEIKVEIIKDCSSYKKRIIELVARTNQLNFTKVRSSKEELDETLADNDVECGVINVKDKYGDYGTVGFYALKKDCNRLIHFLFSCRTLGMGIEQFVYEQLGFPCLNIQNEVATELKREKVVTWINVSSLDTKVKQVRNDKRLNILLKGPCDLHSTLPYFDKNYGIKTEFTFVNGKGVEVAGHNSTTHIVESVTLKENELDSLLLSAPFLEKDAFTTSLFKEKWDIIFFSLLPDSHDGVYRNKETGNRICFSSFNYDFTDSDNWESIVDGKWTTHNFPFTKEILKQFSDNFEFEGHLNETIIIENLRYILAKLPSTTTVVFMLGSEVACASSTQEFANQHIIHQKVNTLVKKELGGIDNVKFIEYTSLLDSPSDMLDCTNHFVRHVNYRIAQEMSKIIADKQGNVNVMKSRGRIFLQDRLADIKNILRPIRDSLIGKRDV